MKNKVIQRFFYTGILSVLLLSSIASWAFFTKPGQQWLLKNILPYINDSLMGNELFIDEIDISWGEKIQIKKGKFWLKKKQLKWRAL